MGERPIKIHIKALDRVFFMTETYFSPKIEPLLGKNEDRQISTTIQKNLNSIRTKARHSALKWCLAQLISGIDLHHLLDIVGNF
uniref:Uncharacterized protein n=1 Tax=Trichogramma kaykai TaxID=54128 RepID=A0ABD2VT82_9HYME